MGDTYAPPQGELNLNLVGSVLEIELEDGGDSVVGQVDTPTSGAWGGAVVELQIAIGGGVLVACTINDAGDPERLTAPGRTWRHDCRGARWAALVVTTASGSAATAPANLSVDRERG